MVEILAVIAVFAVGYIATNILSSMSRKRKISRIESEKDQNMDNVG